MKSNEISLSNQALLELLETTLSKKASFRFQAKGYSMSPFIKDRDVVTVSPLLGLSICLGAPVAFIHPQTKKLVIHRVVGKKGSEYIIKGDGVCKPDGFVSRKDVLGIVTKIEREGRETSFGLGPEGIIIVFLSRAGFLPLIFRGWGTLRKVLGYCLGKSRKSTIWRRVARSLRCGVEVKEADKDDMSKVSHWLNPGAEASVSYPSNVTNFVAKKTKKIIGFVQLVRHPDKGNLYAGYWLFGLIVRFLDRGSGIGEELAKNVIRKAAEEGAKELSLLVYEDNHGAIRLYRKLGFEMRMIPVLEKELEKEKLERGRRRVVMVKTMAY